MSKNKRLANVSEESLMRIFTIPEAPESTLGQIEQHLSVDLDGFLRNNIVAIEKPLVEIEKDFSQAAIPEEPTFVSDYTEELMKKLVSHSVHTASPSFIGHMTSALPYFLLPLSKVMVGLNQNLVKIETSKAFTPLERQVLGNIHRLVYQQDDRFYQTWMHSSQAALGAFCSGGTVANITALWIAQNHALKPDGNFKGIAREGLFRALRHYDYEGLAVLVSERGHYSLGKAADLLGIGRDYLISVETDDNNRVRVDKMAETIERLNAQRIKVVAIVGVAGTTETGNIDPLNDLADLAQQYNCHFHVDAAWGGATLLSNNNRHLLHGIERADSVTIDAHKQMYVPMGAGIVVFKSPGSAEAIEHHANYILRKGSKDLGSHSLEGSRPGMAMLVNSCFQIIGRKGYEMLIDKSIDKAKYFANMINESEDFELITEPELCILTYRFIPKEVREYLTVCSDEQRIAMNEHLNELTRFIQKRQRESGRSFVSRTRLTPIAYQRQLITVFRVVLANPLTTEQILEEVLEEQRQIAASSPRILPRIKALAQGRASNPA